MSVCQQLLAMSFTDEIVDVTVNIPQTGHFHTDFPEDMGYRNPITYKNADVQQVSYKMEEPATTYINKEPPTQDKTAGTSSHVDISEFQDDAESIFKAIEKLYQVPTGKVVKM